MEDDCFKPTRRQAASKRQPSDDLPEQQSVDPRVQLKSTFTKDNYNTVTLDSLFGFIVQVNSAVDLCIWMGCNV